MGRAERRQVSAGMATLSDLLATRTARDTGGRDRQVLACRGKRVGGMIAPATPTSAVTATRTRPQDSPTSLTSPIHCGCTDCHPLSDLQAISSYMAVCPHYRRLFFVRPTYQTPRSKLQGSHRACPVEASRMVMVPKNDLPTPSPSTSTPDTTTLGQTPSQPTHPTDRPSPRVRSHTPGTRTPTWTVCGCPNRCAASWSGTSIRSPHTHLLLTR
jgi:hypothetical protein